MTNLIGAENKNTIKLLIIKRSLCPLGGNTKVSRGGEER